MKTAIKVSNKLGVWISDFELTSEQDLEERRNISLRAANGYVETVSMVCENEEFFFGCDVLKESVITIIKED